VPAMRDSLRGAAQVCSASLRIIGSISVNSTSRTNVSSVDRWRVTGYTEVMPRNRLSTTWDRSPAKVEPPGEPRRAMLPQRVPHQCAQ
jgi:hypothetical protein